MFDRHGRHKLVSRKIIFNNNLFLSNFPAYIYIYASNKNLLVKAGLATTNLLDIFMLPMSRQAHNEFLVFKEDLDSFRADNDQTNVWVSQWSGGLYSSRQYYRHHFESITPSLHSTRYGKLSACQGLSSSLGYSN